MTEHHDDEDILLAFAVEPEHDRATLERYMREYPHLADDLVDLSLELRLQRATAGTTAMSDEAWVEASLSAFNAASPTTAQGTVQDPFATVSSAELVALRRALDVPSGVIQGFRSRIVDIATVPAWFIDALAQGLRTGAGDLRSFMKAPPRLAPGLSYKSDDAPIAEQAKVTFEDLLKQCKVPEEKRNLLLSVRD
jgi:hypothetical protein